MAACTPPKSRRAQHTIQLAYNLVTATDPETTAILDNVILLLWFSINPDGQNMVANWYRSNLGTPYEVSNMPGAVPGIHRARQQSRRLHEQHGRVAGDHARPISNITRRSSTTITRPRPSRRASGFRRSATRSRSIRIR